MASYQPHTSSFKSSTVPADKVHSPESSGSSFNGLPAGMAAPQQPELMVEIPEGFIGCLEVYIHQARDIHNICIYHKQDVYAKICLTSDPEASVSTKIINGGGKNPVFNEGLNLNVRTVDSSLKCEIWMLSRVKNYLEDQLLGFALVPLSEVVIVNGKLSREFSLSSTDLFHSPAGFVQLSLSYVGSLPEVIAIAPHPPPSVIADNKLPDSEKNETIPSDYDKIEFPDLKVVKENQIMVSEYFGLPSDKLESECSESLVTSEDGNFPDSEAGVRVVKSFSSDSFDSIGARKGDTPRSTVSTNGSPAPLADTSQSEAYGATGSPDHKEKMTDGEADSSASQKIDAFVPPLIKIDIPEQKVVQQDIVDMYMKSMQQFTESLAKMKLPMDVENDGTSPENADTNSGSEQKTPTSKGAGSRVFYGSRAFF